jgi:hypothetical protein
MKELLQPGDIFSTKGSGIAGWAVRNLMRPSTPEFHFGYIWFWDEANSDWILLESRAPKGLRVAHLNWYKDRYVTFYRMEGTQIEREWAPLGAISMSPALYDFWVIIKFFIGGVRAFLRIMVKERKIRRLQLEDLDYVADKKPICTEVVAAGSESVGKPLIKEGIAPVPNALKQAELDEKMKMIGYWPAHGEITISSDEESA